MLKKGFIGICLLVAIGIAIVLAKAGPPNKSHASDNQLTLYHLHLNQPNEKQKLDTALHNLIGIDTVAYHPDHDSVTVTFEYNTMHSKWIERALESQGILFKVKP